MADQPCKSDIQAIIKRLRSIPTNKQCFDCGSNNPTWASVTYGIFLCIDCSAVHRSLGVHVTFIRSTQLDTNWTWLQLRAMQVGGNANATLFFNQHGYLSSNSQQKYHCRAATLYKEKLHHMATQAMRIHGTKIHIHNVHHEPTSPVSKEVDFFQEHTEIKEEIRQPTANGLTDSAKLSLTSEPQPIKNGNTKQVEDTDGPNVDVALNMSPMQAMAQAEPRKSLIGAKKTTTKKGKKLGVQKVKTDFNQLENRAQQLDKEQEDLANARVVQEVKTKEDQEKQMASMRLAYKDMSIQRQKEEEKLKISDPMKAQQLDRLGMGFGGSRDHSHSISSDIKAIEQEAPNKYTSSYESYSKPERSNRFFEDELDTLTGFSSGPPKDDFGSWGSSNKSGSWDIDRFNSKQQNISETIAPKVDDKPSRARKNCEPAPASVDAQKKFGKAKSISSEQYFGKKDPDFEMRQNLAKYEGSSSISSSDLFSDDRHNKSAAPSSVPDLQDIKDGVRQGVTKVAGKLSILANGVMNTLQRK